MDVDLFDFDLPEERIALRPAEPRHAARLLVVENADGATLTDSQVIELPQQLEPGDCLVFNNTKVIPAHLVGQRHRPGASGAKVEVTLHQRLDTNRWLAFARPAKRLREADVVAFGDVDKAGMSSILNATIEARGDAGEVTLFFDQSGQSLDEAIDQKGHVPLPPYIAGKRATDERDLSDYQTVYAEQPGAVAAPTAGLHFTELLIEKLKTRGIGLEFVTLHVGAGTFLPVKVADTADHRMHSEWGEIDADTAFRLNQARNDGGRIVAVGTTSLRLLESAAGLSGQIEAFSGTTDIFIEPGYKFRAIDGLLTNFHLPRSTLFMLVSAMCGLDTMQNVYKHAIEECYRFYSYGDACLLWPGK